MQSVGDVPVLEITGVTKTYRTADLSVEALRNVDLRAQSGEYLAIMGPSGSGKTTLLGILGCLDRPTSGSYKLVGQEVANLGETERATVRGQQIGFIFQAYNLLPRLTAFRNVELPLIYAGRPSGERRARASAALAEVGLADRVDHLPSQLSGGQQQRVAIARALAIRPSVLLADEPTGNLDSRSAEDVLEILDRLHADGATIVMVTHSEEVAHHASRIIRFSDGVIVSDELSDRVSGAGTAS